MCIHAHKIIKALNFQQVNSFEIPKSKRVKCSRTHNKMPVLMMT